jgi:hypothetical protein
MKKKDIFITLDLIEEGSGDFITTIDLTLKQTVALLQFAIVEGLKNQIKFMNDEDKENV